MSRLYQFKQKQYSVSMLATSIFILNPDSFATMALLHLISAALPSMFLSQESLKWTAIEKAA